jgi:hypothetical protein
MVYVLRDNALRVSAGYENIDPERPFEMTIPFCQTASVKFLRPDDVDWRAKRHFNPMTAGYPVDPNTVPRMLRWCDKQLRRAPEVDLTHNTMLISEGVRNVIERFEPGVHQFPPVDIYLTPYKEGDLAVTRSYWLVVGQFFDGVNAELTHHPRGVVKHPDGSVSPGVWRFEGDAPVIFDRKIIAGRHLWIDLNFTKTEHPLVSDELGRALLDMDLYGARLEHFDEA